MSVLALYTYSKYSPENNRGREGNRTPTGQLPFKYTFTEKKFEIVEKSVLC